MGYGDIPGEENAAGTPGGGLPAGVNVGDIMFWDGTSWIPNNEGVPAPGSVLFWDGASWVPTNTEVILPPEFDDDTLVGLGGNWVVSHGATVLSQLNWEINSTTGNDGNSGAPGDPLLTWGEFARRIFGKYVAANVDVLIVGNVSADASAIQCFGPASAQIRIHGTPVAAANGGTGAITAFQAMTNTLDAQLADTGATWATHTKKRLRLTSGPSVGALAFVEKDLGAATARVGQFTTTTTSSSGSTMTAVTPAIGNTYALETLPDTIGAFQIEVLGGLRILVEDLTILVANGIHDFITAGYCTGSASTRAVVKGCIFSGTHNFRSCHAVFASCSFDGLTFFSNGIYISNGNTWWNTCTVQQLSTFSVNIANNSQASRVVFTSGAKVNLSASWAIFDVGSGAGLEISSLGSAVHATGTAMFWGTGLAGMVQGILIRSTANYVYATQPTLGTAGGATNDTTIGGTNTAYAGIPAINAANNAAMVAFA